jgi:phytoene/squalene synthetase
MMKHNTPPPTLAQSITRAASSQTYYTIRFLVDPDRVTDAYRAYAYFRWVDDTLDTGLISTPERGNFLEKQKSLLEMCYRNELPKESTPEENMLIELVKKDQEKDGGLQIYLRNMMKVMDFDARRRGRLISQVELNEYTRWLATAVTEAMHHFIGYGRYSPHDETRYLAVTAAHITHMLRDLFDDVQAGYYNIPREALAADRMHPKYMYTKACREWVRNRVQLARTYFQAGRDYLSRVADPRCRLAGYAYTSRFEWLLDTFEKEDYFLRPAYAERKSLGIGLQMGLSTLSALFGFREQRGFHQPVTSQPIRKV